MEFIVLLGTGSISSQVTKKVKGASASGMVQRKVCMDLRTRDCREAISHLLTLYQRDQRREVGD